MHIHQLAAAKKTYYIKISTETFKLSQYKKLKLKTFRTCLFSTLVNLIKSFVCAWSGFVEMQKKDKDNYSKLSSKPRYTEVKRDYIVPFGFLCCERRISLLKIVLVSTNWF